MDAGVVEALKEELARHEPGFRVAFKDESLLMRLIGALVWPFNRGFMTSFTTTLGKTVYFPSRAHYEASPMRTMTILAHEFVHVVDDRKHGFWFRVSYLLPQALFLPALALALIGLLVTSWSWVLVIASFGALGPWPSPWRAKWESRGYTMNLAVTHWVTGATLPAYREQIAENFYGANYYFMVNGAQNARQLIDECAAYAASPRILLDGPYAVVRAFLQKQGLTKSG